MGFNEEEWGGGQQMTAILSNQHQVASIIRIQDVSCVDELAKVNSLVLWRWGGGVLSWLIKVGQKDKREEGVIMNNERGDEISRDAEESDGDDYAGRKSNNSDDKNG
jgi:hypothetical protein